MLYQDLQDIFDINKEFNPGEVRNVNKLPSALIEKLILYSSKEGDLVCDFFMGNFTTAYTALKLGRHVTGYEINKNSFDYHYPKLKEINFGCDLLKLKKVENHKPINQGKKITQEEIKAINEDFLKMFQDNISKKDIYSELQKKYERGKLSIKNILSQFTNNPNQ